MDLTIDMEILLMRDSISKKWDIPAEVTQIRQGGRSAYMRSHGSERTYLRNRRLLRIDTVVLDTENCSYLISCKQSLRSLVSSLKLWADRWEFPLGQDTKAEPAPHKSVDFQKGTKLLDRGPKYRKTPVSNDSPTQ